jgi:anti-sigma factor RsiW
VTCSDFHDRFSDYYDGTAEPSFLGEADAHLAACPDCRRYHSVLVQGSAILRSVPRLSVSEDFFGRLQHRIYHLEDASTIGREAGSATTVSAAVAIAALIALAAWSPALVRAPRVELAPIVVSQPEPRALGVRPPQLWMSANGSGFASAVDRGLWDDPELFTRYSPLMAPSVQMAVVRRADLE